MKKLKQHSVFFEWLWAYKTELHSSLSKSDGQGEGGGGYGGRGGDGYGGVLTSASGLGQALIDRLSKNGIHFDGPL